MKICSLDLEMTGLDIETCDILEFGCVLDDLSNQRPIEELPTFECYFSPVREGGTYQGSPYALQMHPEIFRRIAEKWSHGKK